MENHRIIIFSRVKTCTCAIYPKSCTLHKMKEDETVNECASLKVDGNMAVSHNPQLVDESLRLRINEREENTDENTDLQLPIENLSIVSALNEKKPVIKKKKERVISYEKWLAEKNQLRQLEQERLQKETKAAQDEKKKREEEERKKKLEEENYTAWLKRKERVKSQQLAEQAYILQMTQKRREEEEARRAEARAEREKWLQRKFMLEKERREKAEAEKKAEAQEKEDRKKRNLEAFDSWLVNARNRSTSRSSSSTSFFNPNPWIPPEITPEQPENNEATEAATVPKSKNSKCPFKSASLRNTTARNNFVRSVSARNIPKTKSTAKKVWKPF